MSRLYPPDHPLGSACLKVRRATTHINALKRSVDRLFKPQFVVSRKTVFEGQARLITIRIDPGMRDEWGLMIGDIATNLRASLDHIAWALAMTHAEQRGKPLSDDEERDAYFPLFTDRAKYDRSSARKDAFKVIPPAAQPTMEQFQPYHQRKSPQLKMLQILNDLANTDKHRVVPITRAEAHISFRGEEPSVVAKLSKSGEFQFLGPVATGHVREDVEPDITFGISVYRPGAFRDVDIGTFRLMRDFIRDQVMPAFAGFV